MLDRMASESLALPLNNALIGLVAALAVGLIVGLERGWHGRELPEGSRVAGLRTFALIGLFGGVSAQLREPFGAAVLAAGLVCLGLLGVVSYAAWMRSSGRLSATSSIAALLTCVLGALAASGAPVLAVGTAVVVAVLLDLKSTLHRWLRRIEQRELSAALQMGVISLVVLPLLPDQGYGPDQAINPYRLWWAVVIVSGLSLGGHVAMRAVGAGQGMFWTGLLGGLASSTAATLTLARQARADPRLTAPAAAGALAACGVMALRMTLIALTLQPAFGRTLALPLVVAGLTLLGLAGWGWRQFGHSQGLQRPGGAAKEDADNAAREAQPFDLSVALGFAAFLGVMAVLGRAAHGWLGAPGVHALALLSGLADVDAILITVSRMQADGTLGTGSAVLAVGLAVASNQVTKAVIARSAGSAALARQVLLGYAVALLTGTLAAGLGLLI